MTVSTTWVDPSGFSLLPTDLTPAQTAILVALMVSLPAAATLSGGIALAFALFGLTIRCALTDGCRDLLGDMNELMANLGSAGLNTMVWTAETLNEAFAHYPLLPAASLPMQFLAGLGLGALGLDTVTDFATLITGRDPLTGHALTPQEMFITWLAFSIPFVSAGGLRGFADDAVALLDRSSSRYRVKYHYGLAAGEGETDLAGNIWISPKGSRTDRLRALYHEQVHAYILKHPLLRPLSMYGYPNSQLWRYTEEAIAESRAQLRTGGRLVDALSHPFHPGYKITTAGLLTEAGSLGLLGYSAYWLWSEATSCDPSGTC